MHKTSIALSRQ